MQRRCADTDNLLLVDVGVDGNVDENGDGNIVVDVRDSPQMPAHQMKVMPRHHSMGCSVQSPVLTENQPCFDSLFFAYRFRLDTPFFWQYKA